MTLDACFRIIADWFEAHDGKDGPAFKPPATDHQIAEAERYLGVAFPPARSAFYQLERFPIRLDRRHGGDFGSGQGARRERCRSIVTNEQRGPGSKAPRRVSGRPQGDGGGSTWSETAPADEPPPCRTGLRGAFQLVPLQGVASNAAFLNGEFPNGVNPHREDDAPIDVPPEVRAVWWSRGWLPIMENGGGDHVCVDLDPAGAGTSGQLVTYYHDEPYRSLVASGMDELLRPLAERLRSGECHIDEHGLIEGVD